MSVNLQIKKKEKKVPALERTVNHKRFAYTWQIIAHLLSGSQRHI